MDGRCVNKGRRGAAPPPHCEPSIDGISENTGLCGFGCLVCWLLGGLPTQSKYRQHLGKRLVAWFVCCWWATHPFCFTLLPLVGVLVGSACLACCLLGFGFLLFAFVAWFVGCLVGLLAWPRCCLVGWSVGWHSVDGCMDGWMLCKWGGRSASPAMQTKPPPHGISSICCTWELCGLVAWFVGCFVGCWLGRVVAWLVGRFGWHSVDGWMHGWMDGWILCCLAFRRRLGQFPAVPVVPDSLYAVSGGFRRASNKKLLR